MYALEKFNCNKKLYAWNKLTKSMPFLHKSNK